MLTGWTRTEIGRRPADEIRRLIWRVFARLAWDPDLAAAARTPAPTGPNAFEARNAIAKAQGLLRVIEGVLWPEDDDGK